VYDETGWFNHIVYVAFDRHGGPATGGTPETQTKKQRKSWNIPENCSKMPGRMNRPH